MAKSSANYFEPRIHLSGVEHPAALNFRLANSATLTIGDVVRINTAGLLVRCAAGDAVLGVLAGVVDENDINPFSFSYVNNTGATLTHDDTVVTASDNSTRTHYLKGKVIVDVGGTILYYNDSSDTLAQTNVGQFFDHDSDADQIDVSTASDTSGQFQLVVLDPDGDSDVSKGLFRVSEPQLLNYHANATAVNEA